MASEGYDVCVNYLNNENTSDEVIKKIKSLGRKAIAVSADVSKEIEVDRLFKTVDNELGTLNINVSSAASRLGSAGEYIDYAATKGAIDTLTIGLPKEVADEGIRMNSVRPGLIYTDMHRDGAEADRVNRLKSQLPMKRGGDAEEVAAAIAWLASDESSYTTGSFIEVSGGR